MTDFILAAFFISGTLTFISFVVRTLFEVLKMSIECGIARSVAEQIKNADGVEFITLSDEEETGGNGKK